MALEERKISLYQNNIKDLPDQVAGKAAWLKEFFDSRGDNEIKNAINGVVEDLRISSGAAEIGATYPYPLENTSGKQTVQDVMEALVRYVDKKAWGTGGGLSEEELQRLRSEILESAADYTQQYAQTSAKEIAIQYAQDFSETKVEYAAGYLVLTPKYQNDPQRCTLEFVAASDYKTSDKVYIGDSVASVRRVDGTAPVNGTWKAGSLVTLKVRGGVAYFQ